MDSRSMIFTLFLVLGLLSAANTQEATVSLSAGVAVMEGMLAEVCIVINDQNLLDPNNPPSVRISTAPSETGPDFVALEEDVMLVGEEMECFEIQTIDDDVVEPSESFMVLLSNANGVTIDGESVAISITDNGDLLGIDFSDSTLAGTEGNDATVCIEVTSGSNQLPGLVNVVVEVTSISADFSDISFLERSLNIPVGANVSDTYCTTITLTPDNVVEEPEETFSLRLMPPGTGASFVNIPDASKIVTITDGDRGNVRVNTVSVVEGNSTNTVNIVIELLSFILQRDVVYRVQLTDGTATAGSDYENLQDAEVTFTAGSTEGATELVMVQIIGDEVGEPDETFDITLVPVNPDGDDGLTESITISDDEPKCPSLNAPSNGDVAVTGLIQGSTATYSCNTNYVLVGVATRTCGTNAMWTGMPPICALIRCSVDPPALENGRVVNNDIVGAMAMYSCNSGFRFNTTDSTRTCQNDGMWSDENIACEMVPTTPTPSPSTGDDDDSLSGGAIAGIVIAILVIIVILVVLVILLVVCLHMRRKNHSGKFKPAFETQDHPTKLQKADIGEPIAAPDAEAGTAETELTESSEMLVN